MHKDENHKQFCQIIMLPPGQPKSNRLVDLLGELEFFKIFFWRFRQFGWTSGFIWIELGGWSLKLVRDEITRIVKTQQGQKIIRQIFTKKEESTVENLFFYLLNLLMKISLSQDDQQSLYSETVEGWRIDEAQSIQTHPLRAL